MHFTEQPDFEIRMKTYLSRFASVDEEWPQAWALVEVEPSRWSCTVPVHELVHILLTRSADSDLRRLPHEWHGEEFVLELGAAAVTATAEEWLALCRRLIDTAKSAKGVQELPDTPPWQGQTFPVPPTGIVVVGGASQSEPTLSPVDRLALAGGFEPREFVELLGAGWISSKRDHPGDAFNFDDDLFLWGSPAQLGATTDLLESRLEIGVPRATWSGPAQVGYELADRTSVSRELSDDEIRAIVGPLLARRRRSFTWCRYCGERIAPEDRFEPNVCRGCATEWFGIVY